MRWFRQLRELREQNDQLLHRVHELQSELSQARESYDLLREQITLSQEAEIENQRRMINFFSLQATGRKVFSFAEDGPDPAPPQPLKPVRPAIDEIARQANEKFYATHRPVAMGVPMRHPEKPKTAGDTVELSEESA